MIQSARRLVASAAIAVLVASCGPGRHAGPSGVPPSASADPEPEMRSFAVPRHHTHWSYEGSHGPEHWGRLDRAWSVCGEGETQSPIDIDQAVVAEVPPLVIDYRAAGLRIVHHEHVADVIDTGHSIQVNVSDGGTITLGGDVYQLVQLHLHTPSEHTIHGMRFPMEMHLVHRNASGELAVLGILFREGSPNAGIERILHHLPTRRGIEYHYANVRIDGSNVLPADRTSFRYEGSLTTPPCTQGVHWIVLVTPSEASAEQIAAIRRVEGENDRPTQPLRGRVVVTDHVE